MTASDAWLFNQIGSNLTGLLLIVFALGLWRALSPDALGRLGAGTLLLVGNDSWHADAHKMESRFTTAVTLLAPIILAFAFRRIAPSRDTWIPTLAAVPASIVVGILFSGLGVGAATRATSLTWMLWAAFVAFRLLQKTRSHQATT